MTKLGYWVVLNTATGARLCRDLKWRSHANFGTPRSCVKLFTRRKWAMKAAWRYRVQGLGTIRFIPDDQVMDASGKVLKRRDDD